MKRSSRWLGLVLICILLSGSLRSQAQPHTHWAPIELLRANHNIETVSTSGGVIRTFAVQQHHLYAVSGSTLRVFDTSDASNIRSLGSLFLSVAEIPDLAASGSYVYIAAGAEGLRIVDVSDPHTPVEVGRLILNHPPELAGDSVDRVVVAHPYAYLVTRRNALTIVDISDPSQPQVVSQFPSAIWSVAVAGNYAYIGAEGNGVQIIDLSDPSQPTQAGQIQMFGYEVTVAGNHLAVLSQQYLHILDLSNPIAPQELGRHAIFIPREVAIAGNFAYVLAGSPAYTFEIIDIAQPQTPVKVATLDHGIWIARNLAVAGTNVFYHQADRGLVILDASTPSAPRIAATYRPVHVSGYDSMILAGNYLYVGDKGITEEDAPYLHIIDVTDPSTPIERSRLISQAYLSGSALLAVTGEYAYVKTSTSGEGEVLRVIDVSDPAAPQQIGSLANYQATLGQAIGNHLYGISGYPSELTIVDVTQPTAPRLAGTFQPGLTWIDSLAATPGLLYVGGSTSHNGFVVALDISSPGEPREVGRLTLPPAEQVHLHYAAGRLYLSYHLRGDEDRLVILDATDPANLQTLSTLEASSLKLHDVSGQYALVWVYRDAGGGLLVLDVSDPTQPQAVGSYAGLVDSYNVNALIQGRMVYLAYSSLQILRYTGLSIHGRVFDGLGRPVPGVSISADGGRSTSSDQAGAFAFKELPAGSYTVTPHKPGLRFEPASRSLSLPEDWDEQGFTALPAPVSLVASAATTATLSFSDTQGLLTQVVLPAGAVSTTTTVSVTAQLQRAGPGLFWTGHAFELGAEPAPERFNTPLQVSIAYSDLGVQPVSDEGALALLWWDGSAWRDTLEACGGSASYTRDIAGNSITAPLCRPGRYTLVGPSHTFYLPGVGG